jgi:hypothetical protein
MFSFFVILLIFSLSLQAATKPLGSTDTDELLEKRVERLAVLLYIILIGWIMLTCLLCLFPEGFVVWCAFNAIVFGCLLIGSLSLNIIKREAESL